MIALSRRYLPPMTAAKPQTSDGAPPLARSSYAWYVVAILTLASISANIDQQILNLLVRPIERDLGIGDVKMSYLIGLGFALFFAILGLPIARWADRANRRNIMAGGVGLWSVFTSLCATAQTYGRLLALRVGVGVGEATLNAPSVSLLADYFPRERLGAAMSIYSLGIFVGSGAAYFIGGWFVGRLDASAWVTLPVVGTIRPWQTAFLAVGLPGMVIALLFLTVREPARRERVHGPVPIRSVIRYVTSNGRAYGTHSAGFGFFALVNLGIAAWLPTFFERTYGWSAAQAGKVQGILTMTVGAASVVAGGWLTDWLLARGVRDAPLRVGMVGAVGMLVAATAYPLMPTATLAVVWLAVVNVFAALPWGAASVAAAEMAPAALRAQGAALFFFVLSFSRVFGPSAVAWLTEYAFHDPAAVRYSLAIVNVVGMSLAFALLAAGLGAYRRTVERRDSAFLDAPVGEMRDA